MLPFLTSILTLSKALSSPKRFVGVNGDCFLDLRHKKYPP